MNNDKFVRKSFRLPMGGPNALNVEIEGNLYSVVDIGTRGIGIRVPRSDTFILGSTISSINISLEDTPFNIEGVVVHVSADNSDFFLCGILLNLNQLPIKKFEEYVNRFREKIFENQ